MYDYQTRVYRWILACFGDSSEDKTLSRAQRFMEEALELVQSANMPKEQVLELVDYTYGRPVGQPSSEIGGVILTLASLSTTLSLDMMSCGEEELIKNYGRIEKIRAKAAAKVSGSALPGYA